jgi:hypothetical protein
MNIFHLYDKLALHKERILNDVLNGFIKISYTTEMLRLLEFGHTDKFVYVLVKTGFDTDGYISFWAFLKQLQNEAATPENLPFWALLSARNSAA